MISLAKLLGLRGSNRPTISHQNFDSTELETIPDNSDFTREESSGLETITDYIGRNVNLTIRGNINLKIRGNINSGCKILREGNGTLTFEGSVANDFELTIYGRGDIIFLQQPNEEVIRSITNRSGARIICAGTILPQPTLGYRHHNLGITTRQPVVNNIPQQTTRALSQLSANTPSTRPSKQEDPIDEYLPATQKYIDRCHQTKLATIDEQISKLNLTPTEVPLFEGFKDCIMMSYFDDIPVMYDEKYYNLSTLLELYKQHKPDPFSRDPLRLAGISPARTLLNNFDNTVSELKKQREAAKQAAANPQSTEEIKPSITLSM